MSPDTLLPLSDVLAHEPIWQAFYAWSGSQPGDQSLANADRVDAAISDFATSYALANVIPLLAEIVELRALIAELAPTGIELACDECGGDLQKCPAACTYRKAHALLAPNLAKLIKQVAS